VGPLPEAVELPVPDAVPTPESGGCGVESASWDRGHGSSQVQAQENTGQQPHMRLLPMERGGDGADIAQTGRRLPHRRREGASATQVLRQGGKSATEYKPKEQTLSGNGDPSPSKRAGANPNPGLTLALDMTQSSPSHVTPPDTLRGGSRARAASQGSRKRPRDPPQPS
jgi:hypothetical protein